MGDKRLSPSSPGYFSAGQGSAVGLWGPNVFLSLTTPQTPPTPQHFVKPYPFEFSAWCRRKPVMLRAASQPNSLASSMLLF